MQDSVARSGNAASFPVGAKPAVLPLRIVVWMNQPSHYQSIFFRELASREGVALSVIYARGQTAERRELGWSDPEQSDQHYAERVLPDGFKLGNIVQTVWRERHAVHLVNGVWAEKSFIAAAIALAAVDSVFFFHAESPNSAQEKGGLTRKLKHVFGRWIVARSRGMFPIGTKGCRYYEAMGIRSDRMFKFSYFTDGAGRLPRVENMDGAVRIAYLGQFVERKRVGDLVSAVALLRREGRPVRLRLIGAGPLRETYAAQAAAEACDGVVSVEGPVAPARVAGILCETDVVVLPSAFDGWGLTVNEALHAGVPVIVSDGCGVAEVVRSRPAWGEVVPVGDVPALAAALRRLASLPPSSRPDPAEVASCIGSSRMTDHFLACVIWAIGLAQTKPALSW